MGIDIESARFLLQSRRCGAAFDHCLTLGRQHYFLGRNETRRLFKEFGLSPSAIRAVCEGLSSSPYSEPFWTALGTKKLETLDASDFEGATVVHDLNEPVPKDLVGRFDAVCDFGTLEHVFNFPEALRSCMEMVKVGGRLVTHTTANNYCGHGFYQFSPELFYSVLGSENGFEMERMVAVEYGPRRRWFDVSNPKAIRARVNLINSFPVLLFVQAKRTSRKPVLRRWPQQSDYVAMWEEERPGKAGAAAGGTERAGTTETLKALLLEWFPRLSRILQAGQTSAWNREYSWRNRRAFQPASKAAPKQ